MHQMSSVWVGEYRPSIACVNSNTFSIIDIQLLDCLWHIVGHDDFEIVDFKCFEGLGSPQRIELKQIESFNQRVSESKLHEFLKWIRLDNPTYLSLQSRAKDYWSLVFFDNQLWFHLEGMHHNRVEEICVKIFNSMMLPGQRIFDFIWDFDHRELELEVTDFIAMREQKIAEQLSTYGETDSPLKVNPYCTSHFPIHPQTLASDEFVLSEDAISKGGTLRILLNCVNSLRRDTLLVFVNSDHELMSPSVETMPFAAPYFLKAKESTILEQMKKWNCDQDLGMVELPPIIGVTTVVMVLPVGFDTLDPEVKIDVVFNLIRRASEMCVSSSQSKIHILDPAIDLGIYEGEFGPRFVDFALNHVDNNLSQWLFFHCLSVESYRHYFELRRQVLEKSDPWSNGFSPEIDGYPF